MKNRFLSSHWSARITWYEREATLIRGDRWLGREKRGRKGAKVMKGSKLKNEGKLIFLIDARKLFTRTSVRVSPRFCVINNCRRLLHISHTKTPFFDSVKAQKWRFLAAWQQRGAMQPAMITKGYDGFSSVLLPKRKLWKMKTSLAEVAN